MKLRASKPTDLPFLEQMLFEAFFWHPEQPRPEMTEFFKKPEFAKLLADWGRPGDRAVIAEVGSAPGGAAWFRFGTEADHSYGFVDSSTPELGIGVTAKYRSRGIGRALLRELINVARRAKIEALSLSVTPENFARQLYESEGFVKVGESGTSWTLLLKL